MKPETHPRVGSRLAEPPTCGPILDAIEQFRRDPRLFRLGDFVQRYEAPDHESREAFAEELSRAIRLEVLFQQFRDERTTLLSHEENETRQAP